MAGEHVAIKSNSQGKGTQAQRDEFKEPDYRYERLRKTGRCDGLDVAPTTMGLHTPVVKVHKRNDGQSPGDAQGTSSGFSTRNKANHVTNQADSKRKSNP